MDQVQNWPFTLTDLEDRVLASCDDMYLEASIAKDICSGWYGRDIPYRELRAVYRKLIGLGLLRPYVKSGGRIRAADLSGNRTSRLIFHGTKKGRDYIALGVRYVSEQKNHKGKR